LLAANAMSAASAKYFTANFFIRLSLVALSECFRQAHARTISGRGLDVRGLQTGAGTAD
jgi:hypothetical protein